MQENMKEYLTEKEAKEKEAGSIYREDPGKGVEQIFGNNPAVSGGETPPENDAAGNADITGIKPSNMARFESGGRVPTLVVLEKYANALGKHIEIKICDD